MLPYGFEPRPDDGIRRGTPDGLYVEQTGEQIGIYVVGVPPCSPGKIADAFPGFGIIGAAVMPAAEPEHRIEVLRRGFLLIVLQRE